MAGQAGIMNLKWSLTSILSEKSEDDLRCVSKFNFPEIQDLQKNLGDPKL